MGAVYSKKSNVHTVFIGVTYHKDLQYARTQASVEHLTVACQSVSQAHPLFHNVVENILIVRPPSPTRSHSSSVTPSCSQFPSSLYMAEYYTISIARSLCHIKKDLLPWYVLHKRPIEHS